MRVLLAFAKEREYRSDNPAEGVAKLLKPSHVEGYKPWPEWAIEKFQMEHGGSMMGLASMLGLYTGQRLSDCLRMRWSDIIGNRINVRQSKTGVALEIRIHSALRAALSETDKRSPIILTTARGLPFTS